MTRRKPDPEPGVVPDWQHIVESLEQGVVAADDEGLVVFMNQAAEQLTGSSLAASRRQHHSRVFRKNRWLSELIEEITDQGHIRAEGEIAGLWGKKSPIRASVSPILDSLGDRTGTVLVFQDLSLARSLESDLQRAQNLDHLAVVVAGLAHEIRNPLGGIRGAAQLLGAEIAPGAPAREYVDLVIREVDRLTKLLERLLELRSHPARERASVNVHRIIDHVLGVVDHALREQAIQVSRAFDPSLPPVAGSEDSLEQVFLNLVQNAVQAVAELAPDSPRWIRVTTRIESDYHLASGERPRGRFLRVDVEDNGPGVPPEARENLFSPFFTTKRRGTGLGLAISHRIVSDHGGTIRFESEPGRTVFRVILPASEERA